MRVGIFSGASAQADPAALLQRVKASPEMVGADFTGEVSTPENYVIEPIGEHRFTIAALDLGIKSMTPQRMAERGIRTHVLPGNASLEQILALNPDGVFLSNGPGRPGRPGRGGRRGARPAGAEDPAVRDLLR